MSSFRESDFLRRLLSLSGAPPHVIEGVAEQDDAAVLSLPEGVDLSATTDFVRGTGFALHRLGHLNMLQLGRYVVAANVSDLAAMGANPLCYLSVIRYGPHRTLDEVDQILRGIDDACREFGCPLVGGDSGSYEEDVLSGTALGTLPLGRRLSRNTIQAGDAVLVSGTIGGAAAALAATAVGSEVTQLSAFEIAVERWRWPTPRLALGRSLLDLSVRVSCMDVSDGLTASLHQLARITGHGFTIEAGRLPIDPVVPTIAARLQLDPVHLACSASVDFELLVACAPQHVDMVLEAAKASQTSLTLIGRCETGGQIRMMRPEGGYFPRLPGTAWDHQTGDASRLYYANL